MAKWDTVGFPCGSAGKESACNAGDLGLIPGLGRSSGEGKGYLQSSDLENSMEYTILGAAKKTRLSDFHFYTFIKRIYSPQTLPNGWLAWGCQRQACCLKVKKKNNVLRRAPGLVWVSKAKDIFLLHFILYSFLLSQFPSTWKHSPNNTWIGILISRIYS